jgi:hypothetical protein
MGASGGDKRAGGVGIQSASTATQKLIHGQLKEIGNDMLHLEAQAITSATHCDALHYA